MLSEGGTEMLYQIDLSKKIGKEEYRTQMDLLDRKFAALQRKCREKEIPVLIAVEGLSSSGKGTLINRLIKPLDPRGFKVFTTQTETETEHYYPFLWRFWNKMPAKGGITILDRSWYRPVLHEQFYHQHSSAETELAVEDINAFEKLLTDDNMVLIKFFLVISEKEQKKRITALKNSEETSWRVTEDDLKRAEEYDECFHIAEMAIEKTDSDYAPWTIIEAENRRYASLKAMSTIVSRLEKALEKREQMDSLPKESPADSADISDDIYRTSVLKGIDPAREMDQETYRKRLKELQKKLSLLHNIIYRRRIPVTMVFEGWDAAGKGGAIRRLTQALDPRGYEVHPFSAPNDIEKAHHYLWRFWTAIPKAGHIGIFDRSWYGRVLVERIEGFASSAEWKRAYREINEMERSWYNKGTVILKFWIHIDKDEQLARFRQRETDPDKQWKITDEDWRNRDKWDMYEIAADDMILRTSTTYAPWHIIEGNSKYYARIKVLETVVDTLEKRLEISD